MSLDVNAVRNDFPILSEEVNGKPLVYLDNGASTQKPSAVINCVKEYYEKTNSNIHRGVHKLSQLATQEYEDARLLIKDFLNAECVEEIIFTSGTTESINLIADCFGRAFIQQDDEILISAMEHHSNIVPWQMLCERYGAVLKVIPINHKGELIVEEYKALLSEKTKLVAFNHISNTLGTINPVKEMIKDAHECGAKVLVDGAQAVAHFPVDVQELNADFYVFSGHKLYAPTGVGILYGKKNLLNALPPYKGGGDMIKEVTFEKTTYNDLPHKLEAGTPNIAGGIGLGAAVKYIQSVGFDKIASQERELYEYGRAELAKIDGLRMIGDADSKTSIFSFIIEGIHPFDVGTILDQLGIAVRTGHHCTQPLMDFFEIPGTVRASFCFYNTKQEVDALVVGIKRAIRMLS